jgi:diguanylate cyclase (GGDEF)-like protein/PAS domain S-box-containing protein
MERLSIIVDGQAAPAKAELREAARALIARMPFLTCAHGLAVAAVAWTVMKGGNALALAPGLALVAVDLLALGLFSRFDAARIRPALVMKLAAGYAAATSLLLAWLAVAAETPAATLAAFAGLFVSALAFMSAPLAIAAVACAVGAAGVAVGLPPPLAALAGATGLLLLWYSLGQRRLLKDLVHRAARIPVRQADAESGGGLDRFVREYEQTGRGWFWETDPEGLLTYISSPLAQRVGHKPEDLLGTPFTALVRDDEASENDPFRSGRSLAFQLSVRMAFSDVSARAAGADDVWWSITGRPVFDADGAFLGFRGAGSDLSETKRAEAEVRRLARTDSLTGLANRPAMMRVLEDSLRTAPHGRPGCALLLVDLDRFKAVNDSQGHLAGDALLQQVAKRLVEVAGKIGQVGRLGGDEFKIVVPRPDGLEALADLAGKCISYLSIPYRINGRTFTIGASVGVALAEVGEQEADAVIRRADLALYAAKATGRGSYRFFEPEMQTVAQDRQVLEHDLRQALADGGLSLCYQPVVHSATETLTGFEALLRWRHPTQGYISPAIFVPIAEESGLIVAIGEWVIRTACAEAARMPDGVRMAVNLSPVQFANPNLPAVIVSALANSQLPASRLELEITEGVFLSQDPKTDEIFAKLKGIGVRLALDDFGTGYSSLGYLKTAPFDKIKIDQSFVRGATVPGSRNINILRAIVSLAEGLGMDTTAEGAETFDELELIRSLGCSHVQGYIFGRAMPADEACALAARSSAVTKSGFHVARQVRQRLIRKGEIHLGPISVPVLIRNISEGGALVECDRGLAPETSVTLEISGCGLLDAQVRWSQGGRIGLCFLREFDTARLTPARVKPLLERKTVTPDYIASGEYLKKEAGVGG